MTNKQLKLARLTQDNASTKSPVSMKNLQLKLAGYKTVPPTKSLVNDKLTAEISKISARDRLHKLHQFLSCFVYCIHSNTAAPSTSGQQTGKGNIMSPHLAVSYSIYPFNLSFHDKQLSRIFSHCLTDFHHFFPEIYSVVSSVFLLIMRPKNDIRLFLMFMIHHLYVFTSFKTFEFSQDFQHSSVKPHL